MATPTQCSKWQNSSTKRASTSPSSSTSIYVSRLFLKARGPNALDGLPDFKFAPVPDGIDFGDGMPDTVFFCDQLMKDVPLPFFKKFVEVLRSSPEVMEPVFDFQPSGELEDDVVDIEELQLEAEGNPNPAVTTLADVVNVEDDTVVKVWSVY
ncbi:hypothetical protein RHMOL_Rhmol07G0260600 [Rhododendron molle]|uniref:Uncharacterized protein n=1 Tax=Rhododendron molle TaxID=49168 RepID=A0ACC0N4L0_RHOML|nr:hypothetical protein RHMOL_Rhmol07G0260600 [Rhododendron molle]